MCSSLPGGISALLCSWIIYRQFLFRGRPACFVSEYKTPLPRFEIKQLSDKLKQDHTSNHLQHLDQRTKNIFYSKNTKNLISKMATISSSVINAMKITPTVAKSAANGSKILTRGSFFDPESQKAFLDKHQQKNTPKITTCSTWSSMNSNSKTSGKWFPTSVNYWISELYILPLILMYNLEK